MSMIAARPDSSHEEGGSETAPRRQFVAQVLNWLGYPSFGEIRHVRRPLLRNPEAWLGREKISVRIVPDYVFVAENTPIWILDSGAPAGALDDPERHRQLYAYATHPEVGAKWYAICDGSEIGLFDVENVTSAPKLRVSLADTTRRWPEIQGALGPRGCVSSRPAAIADLGRHLCRLGLLRGRTFHLTNVSIWNPLLQLSFDRQKFALFLGFDLGDRPYVAALELDGPSLDDLLDPLPGFSAEALAASLAADPRGRAVVVPFVGRVSLEVRATALPSHPLARVVPLLVERVLR